MLLSRQASGGVSQGAAYQEPAQDSVLSAASLTGEELKVKLIALGQGFNQLCTCKEASIKPPNDRSGELQGNGPLGDSRRVVLIPELGNLFGINRWRSLCLSPVSCKLSKATEGWWWGSDVVLGGEEHMSDTPGLVWVSAAVGAGWGLSPLSGPDAVLGRWCGAKLGWRMPR